MPKPAARRSKSKPSTRQPNTRRPEPAQRNRRMGSKPRVKPVLPRWQWKSISPERKLDILGIALAVVGMLSMLALLSKSRGMLTGWWVNSLYQLAGWGAFLLPITLVALGLWLVFRNVERLPMFSGTRLSGMVLLFFNFLTWLHLFAGGGWEVIAVNRGGGYLGAIFERLLVVGIGKVGAWLVLIAWLLVGLAFALDISIPELFRRAGPILDRIRKAWTSRPGVQSSHIAGTPSFAPPEPPASPDELPNGFHPLPQTPSSRRARSTSPANAAGAAISSSPAQDVKPHTLHQPQPSGTAWNLPTPSTILDPPTVASIQGGYDQERARKIETTLASFGVPVHVVEIHRGPTITQYGVEPDFIETRAGRQRVRVAKIVALSDDIALALAAPRIRIQAPVPGRNYVGIEVPNLEISRVMLIEILESENFQRMRSDLRFAVGKDVAGRAIAGDLAAMPHLLIAGTTGAGKSVCINAILCSLLLCNTPDELRLVLVDPKRVELTHYNGLPHLLAPVVVEPERVIGALQWMMREMDGRFERFAKAGVRNILEFNAKFPAEKLPSLVMIIDELADLMLMAPDETERNITRLAQLARATGIHLILATQRPSVNVVTGLIKANFPARIAFMVAQRVDSQVILDQPGAERLLGRGDMLFQSPEAAAPVRLQGAWVSEIEIERLVDFWRAQTVALGSPPPVPGSAPVDAVPNGVPLRQTPLFEDLPNGTEDGDPLLAEAVDIVRREGRASITMLQRKLRIGYTRSARLVDAMEEKGIIGPPAVNSQVREVLDYGPAGPPPEEG